MKQAARIERQMKETQEQLASRTVEATSGGGAVKVVARCDGILASIKIDPEVLKQEAQLLEDMLLGAANNALLQAKEISNTEMSKVTQGFNIPGLV